MNPAASEVAFDGIDNDCDESTTDADPDGDGSTEGDCAPYDAQVHPGAREVWYDGIDQDCLGDSDYDADRDGYDRVEDGGLDCDDTTKKVGPEVEEVCNGVDDDCSGEVDDGASDALTWYADSDQDGHGDPDSPVQACEQPAGFEEDAADCDDQDPAVSPSSQEVLGDAVDDDCDGCATLAGDVGEVQLATLLLDQPVERLREHAGTVALISSGQVWAGGWSDLAVLGSGERVSTWDGEVVWLDGDTVRGVQTTGVEELQLLDGQLALGQPDLTSTGRVLVLEEGATSEDEALVLDGKVVGDRAGSLLSAGDLNGDGLADLLVGVPLGGTGDKGRVYAVLGPITAGGQLADHKQQGGRAEGDGLGASLASGWDANGDGYDDVLAGTEQGDAVLLLGPMKTYSTEVEASFLGEGEVSFSGDVDCDNRADVVVGGALYLAPFEGSRVQPDAWWTAAPSVGVGDVDGDSYDDLLVGGEALWLLDRGGL